ncbi:MAG: aminodeoxychorismate/anthranilate synthase component II [Lachnospiraceae bacterium]|nr:aminodeoxychorismate/anthranilate synthase component II [Lachnospiraceae bacterium]
MILLIDNYDSFSYNLVQLVGEMTPDIKVIRNDELTVEEIKDLQPERIILSPGPGYPKDAGICEEVIRELKGEIPILGVCLGHQAICEVYGANIVHARQLMHGKMSRVTVDTSCPVFKGMDKVQEVARYHSLVAEPETVSKELTIASIDEIGEIMAVYDKKNEVYGLQFHPESILTKNGRTMMENFIGGNRND